MNLAQNAGKFLNKCKDHNGAFLFATLATAWALASTAQTFGLIFNKKIPKEEKKFLVPQEVMDGTFNIATYAAITVPMMHYAGKIASSKFPTNNKAVEGVKTLAAIAGGIISSNVITPLLRNKTGVIIKKKIEEKSGKPFTPVVYNNKSYPYFKANNERPLTMQNYMQITKTVPYSSSLTI